MPSKRASNPPIVRLKAELPSDAATPQRNSAISLPSQHRNADHDRQCRERLISLGNRLSDRAHPGAMALKFREIERQRIAGLAAHTWAFQAAVLNTLDLNWS